MMCVKRLAQSLALGSAQLSPILKMHTAFLGFAKHLNISMLLHTLFPLLGGQLLHVL